MQFATNMTREQYEQRKQRLDEQLREGIALLEAAHRQQVRALELVWSMSAEEALPSRIPPAETAGARGPEPVVSSAPPPAPAPSPPRRRGAGELEGEVEEVLAGLPEEFDRNDVCRALGYEPDRGSLYRVLETLRQDGRIAIRNAGSGRVPTRYKKTGV